jgi:flagellar basal-body rod modification protein FlgD
MENRDMDIVGLNQVASRGGQVESSKNETLDKDDFLQMLVAQLQAQDPLNPMDATGFTAQLAQFSSLEQLQNVNSTLEGMVTSQSIMQNSQAIDFIGKTVSALGNTIAVEEGVSTPIQVDLATNAASAFINIYDAYGGFVRNLELGGLPAGHQNIDWDGLDHLGNQVPDGNYTFEISALNAEDSNIQTTSYTTGHVSGVNFKNGTAYLLTKNQEIPMGDVVEVLSMDDSQQ